MWILWPLSDENTVGLNELFSCRKIKSIEHCDDWVYAYLRRQNLRMFTVVKADHKWKVFHANAAFSYSNVYTHRVLAQVVVWLLQVEQETLICYNMQVIT